MTQYSFLTSLGTFSVTFSAYCPETCAVLSWVFTSITIYGIGMLSLKASLGLCINPAFFVYMLCTLGWWWAHAASHAVSRWRRTQQFWLICSFAFGFLPSFIFAATPGPIWERLIEFGPQVQTFCNPLLKCCVKWASVTQQRQCRGTGVWIVARAMVAVVQKSGVQPSIFQKHGKCWYFHINDILNG